MSKAKKIISALLAVAMIMTAAPVSMFAYAYDPNYDPANPTNLHQNPDVYDQYYYVDTTATTDVIRVAYSTGKPFLEGNVIVRATPSGVPYSTGLYAAAGYGNETPAYPKIVVKFVGRKPASVKTPSATGDINGYTINPTYTSYEESIDGRTAYVYEWLLTGGTATADGYVKYSIEYTIDNTTYTAYAYAHVEKALVASGYLHIQKNRKNDVYSTVVSRHSFIVQFLGKNVYQNGFHESSGSLARGFINWASEAQGDGSDIKGCGSDGLNGDYDAVGASEGNTLAEDGATPATTIVRNYWDNKNNNDNILRSGMYAKDGNRSWAKIYVDGRNETLTSLYARQSITSAEKDMFNSGGLSSYKVRTYNDQAVGGSEQGGWNAGTRAPEAYFAVDSLGSFASGNPLVNNGDWAVTTFKGDPDVKVQQEYHYAYSNYHYADGVDRDDIGEAGISVSIYAYDTSDLYNVYLGTLKGTGSYQTQFMTYHNTTSHTDTTVNFNKGANPQKSMYSNGWDAYASAMEEAAKVLQTPDTNQATINDKTQALITAYNNLTPNFHNAYTVNVYHYIQGTTTEVAPPQSWPGVAYNTKATIYCATNLKAYEVVPGQESQDVVVNGPDATINYYFYYTAKTFPVIANTNSVDKDGVEIKKTVTFPYQSTVTTSTLDQYLGTKEYFSFEGAVDSSVTGWYYDSNFEQPVPETFVMGNIAVPVYAKWVTTPLHIYLDTQIEGKDIIDLGSISPNEDGSATKFKRPTEDPKVDGYLFVEYYSDPELTTLVKWPQDFYLGEGDRTIYGRFEDVNGKIIFESNGGSAVPNQPFTANGDPIYAPEAPTREGYTFTGWYYDRDCTPGQEVVWDRVMPDNTGFIAYAGWKAEIHKISFNLNNPTPTEFDTQEIHYIADEADKEIPSDMIPNPPRRFGYVFSHWVYEGKTYNFTTYPTKDIEVVAVWRSVDTSAFIGLKAYEKLSGSLGDPITTAQKGDIVTVRMTSLTNFYTGSSLFVFMYDATFFDLVGSGASVFKLNENNEYVSGIDASFTAVTETGSLRWPDSIANYKEGAGQEESKYRAMQIAIDPQVTADNFTTAPMGDGEWLIEFQLQVKDTASGTGKVYMDNAWTRTGSNIMGTMFYGWSEKEEAVYLTDNDKVTPDLENAVAEITIDETPVEQSKVKLNANPENLTVNPGLFEATNSSTAEYAGPAETEIIGYVSPVRTGYELEKWVNVDETSDYTEWAEGFYAKAGYPDTLEFKAVWVPINYTINFYSEQENGVVIENGSVLTAYDSKIVPPADPTKTGYDFANWVDKDGNIVTDFPICTGNADYFATWTPATDTKYQIVTHYTAENTGTEYSPSIILSGTTGAKVVLVNSATMPATPEAGVTYINVDDIPTMKDPDTNDNLAVNNIANGNYILNTKDNRNALPKEGEIAPDGSLQFHLYYVGKPVTVVFDAGGGLFTLTAEDGTTSTVSTITNVGNYGAKIVAPAEPLERYGYTFAAWSPTISENTLYRQDRTYTATWTPISTNVQFMNYDGTEQIGELVATDFGASPKAPTAPERAGYDFKGWKANLADTTYLTTLPAVDALNDETTGIAKTYYAYYELSDITVTYQIVGESAPRFTDTYKMGDQVKIREAITEKGYTFGGWTINGAAAADFTMGSEPVVISGTLTAKTIPVLFKANGGYFDEGKTVTETSVNTEFNQTINLPEEPTKAGYNFNGWIPEGSTAQEGEFELGILTEESATYVATWDAKTNVQYYIDIYVMDNNGNYPTDPTETLTDGFTGTVDQPVDAYVPEGRTGFTVAADSILTGTIPAEGELRLEVRYQRNKHTLTTKSDGNIVEEKEYYFEQAIATPAQPGKAGYTFAGWSPEVPGAMPNEAVTLNATWTPIKYTVAFDTDGGSAIASYEQDFDTVIAEPTAPTKTGHTFDYWVVKNADGTVSTDKVVFSATTPTVPLNGVTFKAIYKVDNFNIVYMNGAEIVKTVSVPYGTTKADIQANYAPADSEEPTAVGKIFKDWNWDTLAATMPANEVRIQASWTNKSYKITFNEMGGTPVTDISADFGASIGQYDTTELEGHTFEYWYYTDENTEFVIPSNMPALDNEYGVMEIELKAKWTVKSYTITFNENGGDAVSDITADYNTAITIPTPSRTGYTFDYWYYNDSSTEYVIGSKMPALDLVEDDGTIELTAHWTVKSITITFDANGGEDVAPIVQNYNSYISEKPVAQREGYTFNCWKLNGQEYTIPDYMPAESITLVADWTINTYTINFTETGDSTVNKIVAEYDDPISAPEKPTKEGYTFNYWYYNDPDTEFVIGDKMPALDKQLNITTKEITLTGKWSINQYTITFDTDGGTAVKSITDDFGKAVTKPANPTKSGYTFSGWDKEIPGTIPAENITIKAKWTPIKYTITFDEAGGSTVTDIEADYNTAITKPSDPTRTGYTFAYWYEAATPDTAFVFDKMPLNGANLIAKWNIVQYTITIDADGGTYADGSEITNITLDFDAPITNAPKAPVKAGYTFDNWYTTDSEGNEVVYTFPENMPAENVSIVAKWNIVAYDVIYYNYDGSVFFEEEINYLTEIKTAPDGKPERTHYTFEGWSLNAAPAEDETPIDFATANIKVPVDGLKFYPIFKRVTVTLELVAESTAKVTTDNAVAPITGYIYGVAAKTREATLTEKYLSVKGDGKLIVSPTKFGLCGTGTKVEVYDNVEQVVVETYYLVIFGDVNGDSGIDTIDISLLLNEVNGNTKWSRETYADAPNADYVHYRVLAADLNGDGRVDNTDYACLSSVTLLAAKINQEVENTTDSKIVYYN